MSKPLLDIPQEVCKAMKLGLMKQERKRSLLVYNAIKAYV